MKQKLISYYMDIAKRTSQLSYAKRLKVGAILVKNDNILSFSYNGTPRGWDNVCEDIIYKKDDEIILDWCELKEKYPYSDSNGRYTLKTKPFVTHAEEAMLMKMAISNESTENAILFCTHSCCLSCAKLIYGAKISEFYYLNDYKSNDGIDFLKQCNIKVYKI